MSHHPKSRTTWIALGALALCLAAWQLGALAQNPPAGSPPATSQPADSRDAESVNPRREPSPTDILDMLAPRDAATRPIVRPNLPGRPQRVSPAPEGMPKNAMAPVAPRLYPDGYRLVDRPGRLTREGAQWILAFENRNANMVEPPIRLLPNRMLEDMEIASSGGAQPVVFLVSGEVTEYRGVNYLLVQKMLIRPEMGNLK